MLATKGLMLRAGTVVETTLIAAPSSTKNVGDERDPEMHRTKKGNPWHFRHEGPHRRRCRVGPGAHGQKGTAANVNDVVEANSLLHGDEVDAFGDEGYQRAHKRTNPSPGVSWHVARRSGKRAVLDKSNSVGAMIDEVERIEVSIRAKVENAFRVVKRRFGFVKVRDRGPQQEHRAARDLVRTV